MPYFEIPFLEMPFLSGFILMFYDLFWDAILVRFDIDVFMPSFEMPFFSGLILMSLCPILRWHSCQIWYWCLYALFWDTILGDAILVRFYINVLCAILRYHSCQVDIDVLFPVLRFDRLQWPQICKSYIKFSNVVWIFNIVFRRHVTVMWLLRVNITVFVSSNYNISYVEMYILLINKSQQLL